jgi:hypothetical protein
VGLSCYCLLLLLLPTAAVCFRPSPLPLLLAAAAGYRLAGVLLTHLHMGHYLGLAQFGREAMDIKGLQVGNAWMVCGAAAAGFAHGGMQCLVACCITTAADPTGRSCHVLNTPSGPIQSPLFCQHTPHTCSSCLQIRSANAGLMHAHTLPYTLPTPAVPRPSSFSVRPACCPCHPTR